MECVSGLTCVQFDWRYIRPLRKISASISSHPNSKLRQTRAIHLLLCKSRECPGLRAVFRRSGSFLPQRPCARSRPQSPIRPSFALLAFNSFRLHTLPTTSPPPPTATAPPASSLPQTLPHDSKSPPHPEPPPTTTALSFAVSFSFFIGAHSPREGTKMAVLPSKKKSRERISFLSRNFMSRERLQIVPVQYFTAISSSFFHEISREIEGGRPRFRSHKFHDSDVVKRIWTGCFCLGRVRLLNF